jgi:hypothetical protein
MERDIVLEKDLEIQSVKLQLMYDLNLPGEMIENQTSVVTELRVCMNQTLTKAEG